MIIAIDTATPAVSVALADGGAIVATFSLLRGRRHVETLMPVIEQLLAHAGCPYADVTAVAVDRGPGLFTGLRVGVATAKALALALDVPVHAATSLEILAHDWAARGADADVVSVIDARRREIYAQRFQVRDGVTSAASEPVCVPPSEAVRLVTGTATVVVGDVAVGSEAFDGHRTVAGYPHAERLALMVPGVAPVHPDDLELLYLRAPDAEINWISRPGGSRP